MKLLFPNGEHEPVNLAEGITAIGTGAECLVVLAAPGIALRHAEVHLRNGQVLIRVPDPRNVVVLNGRQVTSDVSVKPGDLLLFAKVGCQVLAPDRVAVPAVQTPRPGATNDDNDGRTRIRQALPKYMLRGVSGSTFGKTFALVGSMTIGRQQDCDISIPGDEISRHHAKLQVLPDGVMIEDMGSANGTFINDKRVHSGVIKPGEELRLDTVRFLLMSPGMEVAKPTPAPAAVVPEPAAKSSAGLWIGVLVVALVVAAVGATKVLGYW